MEKLNLSWQGGQLENQWRGLQQMPADIKARALPGWEALVIKPLVASGLDIQFIEHLEVSLITGGCEAKKDLPLFSTDEPLESVLNERNDSGRLREARRKLTQAFGADITSLLRFRLVRRQVRDARPEHMRHTVISSK